VDPRRSLPIGLELASYLIEERIGGGGMGEVYRALDTRLDRPVALKVLSEAGAGEEGFGEPLMRESRIQPVGRELVVRLRHPGHFRPSPA
jgi:serine/threonine protein kinase